MNHQPLESLVRDVGERLHGPRQSRWAAVIVDPFVRDPFDDGFVAEMGAAKLRINAPLRDKATSRLPYLLLLEATLMASPCCTPPALKRWKSSASLIVRQSMDSLSGHGSASTPIQTKSSGTGPPSARYVLQDRGADTFAWLIGGC